MQIALGLGTIVKLTFRVLSNGFVIRDKHFQVI